MSGTINRNSPASAAGTFTLGGDLTVNRMGFGAMRVTGKGIWGDPTDPEGAKRLLRRVVELGINFIDTSNNYSEGESEVIVGKALRDRRDKVVLATKVWAPMGEGPNQRGLSRKAIQEQVDVLRLR